MLLVGAAELPELFDAIELQYQLILNFFKLEDAGMVLVRGVKDIGDIEETKALEKAYKLGALINKEISSYAYLTKNKSLDMDLLNHLDELHTTKLGTERIKNNISLDIEDVVAWCKDKINSSNAIITRKGKNWYVDVDEFIITINAHSYTIITAHRKK